jgi:hypothetical protein
MCDGGLSVSGKNKTTGTQDIDQSTGVIIKRESLTNLQGSQQQLQVQRGSSLKEISEKNFEPDEKKINNSSLDLEKATEENLEIISKNIPEEIKNNVNNQPVQVQHEVQDPSQKYEQIMQLPSREKLEGLTKLWKEVPKESQVYIDINRIIRPLIMEVNQECTIDIEQAKNLPENQQTEKFRELLNKYEGGALSGNRNEIVNQYNNLRIERVINQPNQGPDQKLEALDNLINDINNSDFKNSVSVCQIFKEKLNILKDHVKGLPLQQTLDIYNQVINDPRLPNNVSTEPGKEKVLRIGEHISTFNSIPEKSAKYDEFIENTGETNEKRSLARLKTDMLINDIKNNYKPREALGKLEELKNVQNIDTQHLEKIYQAELNKFLPVDIVNAKKDDLKNFISNFKEVTKHDKFFMKFGGLTKGVNDSLDNIYTTFKNNPDDLNARVDSIDKSLAKVKKFMEQNPESSKIKWMQVLENNLSEMKNGLQNSKIYQLNQNLTDNFKNLKIDLNKPEIFTNLMKDGPMGDLGWLIANNTKEDAISQIKLALKESNVNKGNANPKFAEQIYEKLSGFLPVTISGDQNQEILDTNKGARHFEEKKFPFETVKINGKDYHFDETIGKGGLGLVQKFTDNEGKSIAIKLFGNNKDAEQELDAHRLAVGKGNSPHDNITNLLGAITDTNGDKYSVMEFVDGVDGSKLTNGITSMSKKNIISFQDELLVRKCLARETLDGLIQVNEKMGLMHLDMKPHNIFYDREKGAKIGDFGNSHEKGEFDMSIEEKDRFGSKDYRAPEIMGGKIINSTVDTYAYGLTLNFMMTGKVVYDNGNETNTIGELNRRTREHGGTSTIKGKDEEGNNIEMLNQTSLGNLVNKTYNVNPEERAKLSQLREDDFFQEDDTPELNDRARLLLDKIVDYTKVNNKLETFLENQGKEIGEFLNGPGKGRTKEQLEQMPKYQELKTKPEFQQFVELEANYTQAVNNYRSQVKTLNEINPNMGEDIARMEMNQIIMEKKYDEISAPELGTTKIALDEELNKAKPGMSQVHEELKSRVKVVDPD